MKVLYEDNHIIVVEKEPNIPVQADDSNDMDLLTTIKDYIKKKYNKPGNVYIGLVQRLDRPVGGVMVFAKTSKAASRLSEEIRNNSIKKRYYALVHGKMKNNYGILEDYLIKDENNNTSKVVSKDVVGSKKAILEYNVINYDERNDLSLLDINLHTGRHHQIRVQLSNIGHSIYGDQRYGNDKVGIQIHLWAHELEFKHPVKEEIMKFESKPKWANLK